ncbi:MAG: hypothetical protein MSA15_03785 [Clostridium sp.]|nr:hypothetical protein [Clostridium sp.]
MKKRYYLKEKKRLKREIREEEKKPSFEQALLFFSEMLRWRNLDNLSWLEIKWKQGKKKFK